MSRNLAFVMSCANWAQWLAETRVTLRASRGDAAEYKYTEPFLYHFTPGKKTLRSSCFNSVWTELLLSSLLFFPLPSGHEKPSLFFLSEHYWQSRLKALFLYRFVKKKPKKRQPKWSPKCVRTTTATAKPLSTGWSTWSCSPPTPTLQWWALYPTTHTNVYMYMSLCDMFYTH